MISASDDTLVHAFTLIASASRLCVMDDVMYVAVASTGVVKLSMSTWESLGTYYATNDVVTALFFDSGELMTMKQG